MNRFARFAWLLAPALFGVAVMAFYDAARSLAARHWQWTETTARVVSRNEYIDFVPGAAGTGRRRRARLVLEYAPSGQTEQVAVVVDEGTLGATAEPSGKVPIRYDPADPDTVVVEASGLRPVAVRFALGGICLALGVGVAWVAWRKRAAGAETN